MNWKSTWVMLTLAGALLALCIFVEHPLREERARQASRFVLPGLNPATVTNVSLTLWGQKLILAERDGSGAHDWRMTQPVAYPASAQPIEELLKALSELQWQDRMAASELVHQPDADNSYGFSQPQYSLELRGPDGARHLIVGAVSALGDQLFVKIVGSYDIYKVSVELTNEMPRSKDFWRDPALVDVGRTKFQSIEVRSLGRSFDLTLDGATGLWNMTKPVQARADSPKIDQLLKRLDQARAIGFVNEEAANNLEQFGLQAPLQTPQLEFSLLRDTNVVFGLQVGSNSTLFPGYAYARRQDPSNVVVIPTGGLLPWEADSTNFLDRHLFSLPASNIDAIEVTGDDSFIARRAGDGWQVSASGRVMAADAIFMDEWLAGLTNVDLAVEKMVVADLGPYGLAKPQLVYRLLGASNQLLTQIEFGSNAPGGVFERRSDESSVNIMGAGDFGRMPRVSWQLRDRTLWNFEGSNVVSVAIHYLGGDRKYLRDPSGQWTFAPGYHGPPFPNWPRLEEALHRLGQLRAIYWDGMGDDPADHFGIRAADHRVSLEVRKDDRKEVREIEFGKRSPYLHPYAAVALDGQRLIFEFPVDLFDGFVVPELTLPAALRQSH